MPSSRYAGRHEMRIVLPDGQTHSLPHDLLGIPVHDGKGIDEAVADDDIAGLETGIRVAGAFRNWARRIHVQVVETLSCCRRREAGSRPAGITVHDLRPDFLREFEIIDVIRGLPVPDNLSRRIDFNQTIISD